MLRITLTRTSDGTVLCWDIAPTRQEAERLAAKYNAMPNITATVEQT